MTIIIPLVVMVLFIVGWALACPPYEEPKVAQIRRVTEALRGATLIFEAHRKASEDAGEQLRAFSVAFRRGPNADIVIIDDPIPDPERPLDHDAIRRWFDLWNENP